MAALGEFEVLVLMAVLRLEAGAYPPAVRGEIERRTGRGVARGAVYITLDRLETKRLLSSAFAGAGPEGGRPRRCYRVSPKGLRAIRRTLSALEQMREGLEPILGKA
jgi:PadR family transcriptional regulator, regulatory protein PadR